MDAYGNRTSTEILTELTLLQASRTKLYTQPYVSESIAGKQWVHNSMVHLDTLSRREAILRAELAAAQDREGITGGHTGMFQIYPIG